MFKVFIALTLISSVSFARFSDEATKCHNMTRALKKQFKGTKNDKVFYAEFIETLCIREAINKDYPRETSDVIIPPEGLSVREIVRGVKRGSN